MPLNDFNSKIDIPYPLSNDERNFLAANTPSKSKDWTASKYKTLKERIKYHYTVVQDEICPYCRTDLRRGGFGEPIEHIVPKDEFPRWMFEPLNLALSCYGCNTKKNAKNTLVNIAVSKTSPYPSNPADFKIIHPHMDIFSTYISQKHNLFFVSTQPKGINTIKICDLNRLDLLFYKAKQSGLTTDESIKNQLIKIQSLPGIEQVIIEATVLMIKDIKARYDYRKQLGIA
jgi:hypothetical protein